MKKILLLLLTLFAGYQILGQVRASATDGEGSGYPAILNAGFDIETPDCVHSDFGAHVTQSYDEDLQRNIFVFHSHIEADNDRCQVFDRVRMEIKGGPNTNAELQHPKGSTSYYRWKFKIAEDFVGGSSFNHVFQNKIRGGNDASFPVITITLRTSKIELRHNGGDTGSNLGTLVDADLDPFRGKWVEGYLKQIHDENGELEFTLKDMATGLTLLEYQSDNIDLWRTGAEYSRPKWGMYRSKSGDLQDEKFRMADFCVSEIDSALCPAEAVLVPDIIPPTAPNNLIATNVTTNSVTINWEAANDEYGVTAYEILQNNILVQSTTELTAIIQELNSETTYTFTVQAKDAAGNISPLSNAVTIATDAENALPNSVSDPFPRDDAMRVNLSTTLSWTASNNTNEYQVFFGNTDNLVLVSTQTTTSFRPNLLPATTYFWKIVSVNINGEISSPIWSFATAETNTDFPWQVYRGNQRPEVETSFLKLNEAPINPPVDEIVSDPNASENSIFGFRSNTDEEFRWRHDFNPTDSIITIVARLKAVDTDVNGICYFEVRHNGWRQKVRINQSTVKLEKTSPEEEYEYDFDWTDFQVFRMSSTGKFTTIYLNEKQIAVVEGVSDTESGNAYFEWGKSGGSDYGAYIDWLAIDKTGLYSPTEGTPLPSDLILNNITATNSFYSENNILLYPNPATEELHIDLKSDSEALISIFNANGQLLESSFFINSQKTINIAHLPEGIYFLQVQLKDGIKIYKRFSKVK